MDKNQENKVRDRVSTVQYYRKDNISFCKTTDIREFFKQEFHGNEEMIFLGITELQKLGEWYNKKQKSHGGD